MARWGTDTRMIARLPATECLAADASQAAAGDAAMRAVAPKGPGIEGPAGRGSKRVLSDHYAGSQAMQLLVRLCGTLVAVSACSMGTRSWCDRIRERRVR